MHHLEVAVRGPQKFDMRLRWHLCYEYTTGGQGVQQNADVPPIAVAAKGLPSRVPHGQQRPNWIAGRYEITVEGWANRRVRTTCHINVDTATATLLQTAQPVQPGVVPSPVEEWRTP